MKVENKRLAYIDVAKGIGMLLVIIGHTIPWGTFYNYIYGVHLPLFFFLSGYIYKYSKEKGGGIHKETVSKAGETICNCIIIFFCCDYIGT